MRKLNFLHIIEICAKLKNKILLIILLVLLLLFFLKDRKLVLNQFKDTISSNYIEPNSEFFLNPKELICNQRGKQLFVAFVIIAPESFERRNVIRTTWGDNLLAPDDFKVIFTVGLSKNSTVNEMIVKEFKLYQDIIQINNFYDSYFNMTTKIMMSLKWITKHCYNAQYILRINDDVMANTLALIKYFKSIPYKKNQLFGHLLRNTRPIRFQHKHQVTFNQFPGEIYPDYPEGIFFPFNNIIFCKNKLYR